MKTILSNYEIGDAVFAELVDELTCLVEAGDLQRAAQFVDEHPAHADTLRRLLPAIEALALLDHAVMRGSPDPAPVLPGSPDTIHAASSVGIVGDFRIVREIGRGGMGVVYEAEQLSLGRRVALKVLPLASTLNEQQLTRFKNEARAAATLKHPHIVGVYSVGVERGVHYYAMELVEGCSLAQAIADLNLAENQDAGGRENVSGELKTVPVAMLSTARSEDRQEYFRQAARIIADAADALEYAHSQGIVHRDIKPGNLLLNADGQVYVTDFGLARLEADAGVTLTGDVLGTFRYMSPEQAAGKAAIVDHRTDIHALGATLFELLTLRPAFAGDDRGELLQAIINEPAPVLRQIKSKLTVDLETVVAKCLEKEPADRYQSAGDLAADLRAFIERRPIAARPPSLAERLQKWGKRHVALVATALLFSLTAAVGLAVGAWLLRRSNAQTLAEKTQAEENLATAEDNLQVAVAAIDRLLREFAEDAHHHGQLHHADTMLTDAVEAYGRVLEHTDDPAVVIKLAATHAALGRVELEAVHLDGALEHVGAGLKLLDELPDDHRGSREADSARASLVGLRGTVLQEQEDFAPAAQWLAENTALREALAQNLAEQGEDNERQGDLLEALKAQAELQAELRDLSTAQTLLDRCVAIFESREKALQGGPWWLDQRSDLYQLAAQLATERGDRDAAVAALTAAVEAQKNALRCLPDSERYQQDLLECRQELATALFHAGKFEEAAGEIATVVAQFPADLSAYIAGHDLLLDCADQTSGALADRLIAQAGELLERAPDAEYFPVEDRRALAWRLATCPYHEYRDGARAEPLASYLCFRDFQNPANLEVYSAALREAGNAKMSKTAAQMAMGIPKVDNPDYEPSGAQLVLSALGEADAQTEYAAEAWAKATQWREQNGPVGDRGLRALFDEAEQLIVDSKFLTGESTSKAHKSESTEAQEPGR